MEAMNANLKIVASLIAQIMVEDSGEENSMRSAMKIYIFFVHWLWDKAEAQNYTPNQASFASRRKNGQQPGHTNLQVTLDLHALGHHRRSFGSEFEWKVHMEDSMSALSGILSLDLATLFHPSEIDHHMLNLCLAVVSSWICTLCQTGLIVGDTMFE